MDCEHNIGLCTGECTGGDRSYQCSGCGHHEDDHLDANGHVLECSSDRCSCERFTE
jgi:hypothetical protein